MTIDRKISPVGHKLGGVNYGCSVRCECGWKSSVWMGKGARSEAFREWRWHQEQHIKEATKSTAA